MEKMVPRYNSELDSALETHNSRKGNQARTRSWSWKVGGFPHVFSVILALILLAVLFIFEFANPTAILKHVKTKRFVKTDDCLEESEEAETVQKDIHIIPEGRLEDFAGRVNRHPNHRYLEIAPEGVIYKNKIKNLYDESGWSPKPLDLKAEERLMKARNIISKRKPEGKNARSKFPNLKSLGDSMGFRGVSGYISSIGNNPGTENFYYPNEINNLIQNHPGSEEDNAAIKKTFKSHGAPFRVPVKGDPEPERLNAYQSSPSKQKQVWFKERFKKRPLTILLDIYPMVENHDYFKKDGSELSHVVEFSKGGDIHSAGKFLFPQVGRKGIIMKLNLYAKERKFSRRQNSIGQTKDSIHLNNRKRAEEKSFGWFLTKKKGKQETKQCFLAALNPHGKHVTAKWKNGNGEWIHANHVSVKY